jgi:acyl-coenzyme A synthetase/AMP-(fatty) acid ligase
VVTGGALSRALADKARALLSPRIITAVGSTEGGNWAWTEVGSDEDLRWHRLNPERTVEVVDEDDEPVPIGRLGLVRVLVPEGGVNSYVADPNATDAVFRDGWFYPGDIGMLDGKGRLALSGRVTDVLNLLGDKIPAAPYEQALQEALGLEGVCMLTEQGGDRSEELHVVLETPEPLDAEVLRQAALTLSDLPDVHVHFHFVDKIPRNHMGKVERIKLRQQLLERKRAPAAQ